MNNNDANTTIADLRRALSVVFCRQRVATCLLRMREAGLVDAGRQGKAGSAAVTVRQAALVLIVLALDVAGDAITGVAEAQRVADLRLRSIEHTHATDPCQPLNGLGTATFLEFLTAEFEALRGHDADYTSPGWTVSATEAAQRHRLVFSGSAPDAGVHRQTVIPGRLIGQITALFQPRDPVPPEQRNIDRLAAILRGAA